MAELSFENPFLVCLVAAAIPLLLGYVPRLRVPSVVLGIVLGAAEVDDAVGAGPPDLDPVSPTCPRDPAHPPSRRSS